MMNELDDILVRVRLAAAAAGVRPCIPDVRRRVVECVQAANPYGCNGFRHGPGCPRKGTTREHRGAKRERRIYEVDQNQPMHKQIADLTALLERASRDGVSFRAAVSRPEFGKLIVVCGRAGPDVKDKKGHGVQHIREPRHHLTLEDVARAILVGRVGAGESPSRITLTAGRATVVLEREIRKGSGRTSVTMAKLHTAMRNHGPD